MVKNRVVVLFSGGIDSTTLLYQLGAEGVVVYPIIFFYGQRHSKELLAARETCKKLGIGLEEVNLEALGRLAPSALTEEGIEVPRVGYSEGSMRNTYVPNRNMVFLSFAASYAIGKGIRSICYAAHGGDHALYPDCRPEFISAMEEAIRLCSYDEVGLEVPYIYWNKADIVRRGVELGVDYSLTWSCYQGGDLACGKCGTCVERLEAFAEVGIKDPIVYERS